MRTILLMDSKNYDDTRPRFIRGAVRAIMFSKEKIIMVKSNKEGYYKFPGGGIENGETPEQALAREVREETGLYVDISSIREYGMVKEIRKGIYEDEIFDQNSYYYLCDIMEGERTKVCLDEYEEELGFELEYVTINHAINVNSSFAGIEEYKFIERETSVLRYLYNNAI